MRRLAPIVLFALIPILGACNMASMGFGSQQRANGKTVGTLVGAVGGGLTATQL